MRRRELIILGMLGLFFASLISGCAGYGKLRPLSGQDRATSIEALEKNWEDHAVYWTGLSVGEPSGIMFDPKKDDRTLVNDKWTKVEDEKTLAEIISWIRINRDYPPLLWRILGPDDQFYGYMYTGWRFGLIREVDERTLYVHDLPAPLRVIERDISE
ncbi:MAG: hypothetical protein KKE57_08565 [Proteobacteria bacterium]|nr:hypothetical protein [Pseudomonadota bacterium]